MLFRVVVILALVLAAGCASIAATGSTGSPRVDLITPTPWPIPTAAPVDCGALPQEKCEIQRREAADRLRGQAAWIAQLQRTYAPRSALPFVALAPRPTPGPATPTPEPSVRPCSASDLVGEIGGTNGAMQMTLRAVTLANQSDSSCGLRGRVAVRLFLGTTPADVGSYQPADPGRGRLVVLPPHTAPPGNAFAPKDGQAFTWVTFSRFCAPPRYDVIELTFAGASALRMPTPSSPVAAEPASPTPTPVPSERCLDAPYFAQVGAFDFEAVQSSVTTESETPPYLRASVSSPPLATAGETYRFQVALTNASDRPVDFRDCPNYEIVLWDGADTLRERHALNCADAVPLAPGASETFAMAIAVPSSWPVSLDGGLAWQLEASTAAFKIPLGIARTMPTGP